MIEILKKIKFQSSPCFIQDCFFAQGLWSRLVRVSVASNFPIFSYYFLLAHGRLGKIIDKPVLIRPRNLWHHWLLKPFVRVLLSWIVVGRYFIKPLLKCTFARKKFKIRLYLKNLELKRYLSNLVFQIFVKLHMTKQKPQFWHQSNTSFVHVFPQ